MDEIQTPHEHQIKLSRAEALITRHMLTETEEIELESLVNQIEAYEQEHYPIAKLSDTVVSAITWNNPVGEVPSDWIEKWTILGFYKLRVWYSWSGFFEASMTHNETEVRSRLDIGQPTDMKAACDKAAEVAIKVMTKGK